MIILGLFAGLAIYWIGIYQGKAEGKADYEHMLQCFLNTLTLEEKVDWMVKMQEFNQELKK